MREKSEDSRATTRRPWHASMSVALALGLGFFVLTAVATVFSVGLISGYRNTVELLRQKAELMTSAELDRLRRYLGAAEDQLDFAARLIGEGEVEPGPSEEFISLMLGSLAATPQIVAILYIDADYQMTGAERQEDEAAPLFASARGDDTFQPILDQARGAATGWWGRPVWREEYGSALMTYSLPVSVEGTFAGALTALVSVQLLSEFISDLETSFGANAFVLYGEDSVLAHPLLAFGYDGLNRLTPLPKQDGFSDPVLSSMWQKRELGYLEGLVLEGPGIHAVTLGAADYVFLYQEVAGYADRPLFVGTYFLSSDMMDEVLRFKWAALFCLLVSLISAATAAFIGRQIAQPVRRLGQGAMRIYELDMDQVEPVPGSFFRELDDSARSFNTMLEGLRWFERYVPRSLVRKLIAAHGARRVETSFRDVVIMFTDIWNFTTFTEDMTAPQTAAFLNDHFTMVAEAIEQEGGVVDKYLGDGVMAIWGAPESYGDLADRACRAVLGIKEAFEGRHRPAGSPRIQLRIGLHLGRVVAGNIGSPGRINYTVVGDAVNVAQRLEELGRSLGNVEAEVNILISGSLRGALTLPFALEPLGLQEIRGRRERVEVYALKGLAP